jgi:thiol-disulfide isomerase/thioredoxin
MNDKSLIVGALALIIAVGAILYVVGGNQSANTTENPVVAENTAPSGPNVPLAQCLKNNGVVFYGAFWCPHCKKQKEDFGAAVPALPYVECSTPDGQEQTPICKSKGVNSYPTWIFPDGSQLTGEQTLEKLAEKGNCSQTLPQSSLKQVDASNTLEKSSPAK